MLIYKLENTASQGGSLEIRNANLTIKNATFFCCSDPSLFTNSMIYLNTMIAGQITNSTFHSTTDTAIIAITGGNEQQNPLNFAHCHFSGKIIGEGLISSYNSPISIYESNFQNSVGTLVKCMGPAMIELIKVAAVNTNCFGGGRGCLLEASKSSNVTINDLVVIDMEMTSDYSVIVLDSVSFTNLWNSAFHNISGSAGAGCLSVFNNKQITIENFTATNFSSGCIFLNEISEFKVTNFIADNSNHSRMIEDEISTSDRSRSVINVEGCYRKSSLDNIMIKGHRNLGVSQGGAIRLVNII